MIFTSFKVGYFGYFFIFESSQGAETDDFDFCLSELVKKLPAYYLFGN